MAALGIRAARMVRTGRLESLLTEVAAHDQPDARQDPAEFRRNARRPANMISRAGEATTLRHLQLRVPMKRHSLDVNIASEVLTLLIVSDRSRRLSSQVFVGGCDEFFGGRECGITVHSGLAVDPASSCGVPAVAQIFPPSFNKIRSWSPSWAASLVLRRGHLVLLLPVHTRTGYRPSPCPHTATSSTSASWVSTAAIATPRLRSSPRRNVPPTQTCMNCHTLVETA